MRFVLIAGVLSASACSAVNSSTLNTNQITAALSVTADNTGEAAVEAILSQGSSSVTLSSGDSLSVAYGNPAVTTALAASSSLFGQTAYETTLDTDSLGPFTIAFARTASGKTPAPNSVVTLPPAFVLTSPASGVQVSASSTPITLTWGTLPVTNETMNWSASGSCISTLSNEQISIEEGEDQTSYTIPAGTLTVATSSASGTTTTTATSCDVLITVSGELLGTIDTHYAPGSTIAGIQTATATIIVTP